MKHEEGELLQADAPLMVRLIPVIKLIQEMLRGTPPDGYYDNNVFKAIHITADDAWCTNTLTGIRRTGKVDAQGRISIDDLQHLDTVEDDIECNLVCENPNLLPEDMIHMTDVPHYEVK